MYRMARLRTRFSPLTNRVQFASMHNVSHRQFDHLRAILDFLSREFTVISYSQAVDRVLNSRIDGQYLALSFDDGHKRWRDVSDTLRSYGMSACFFVCPGIIDRNCQSGEPKSLTWDDVDYILASGHEIGGHTSNHVDLGKTESSEIEDEIGGCYAALKSRTGQQKHFAWPYGRFTNMTREARRAVFEAGYLSCASAVRGAHVGDFHGAPSDLCIRRDNIEPDWPLPNVKYFMLRNGLISKHENGFPQHLL